MRLIVLLFAVLGIASVSPAGASDMNVAYGPDPQEVLDVYTPAGAGHNLPAVLMIHGGGWSMGSRASFNKNCDPFTKDGIVEIPVDYRLAAGTPETRWPAQMEDVQLAMRWVRAHAAQYGIDPSHICAEGDSAGGQLALMLGVTTAIEAGDRAGLLNTVSPHADCVVAISGPSDLVALARTRSNVGHSLFDPANQAGMQAAEADASPALRTQAGAPPTLLIHGLSDDLVPFTQATTMQDALAHVGTPVWLVTHEGGHELNGMTPEQVRKTWQLIRTFVKVRSLPVPPSRMPVEDAVAQER